MGARRKGGGQLLRGMRGRCKVRDCALSACACHTTAQRAAGSRCRVHTRHCKGARAGTCSLHFSPLARAPKRRVLSVSAAFSAAGEQQQTSTVRAVPPCTGRQRRGFRLWRGADQQCANKAGSAGWAGRSYKAGPLLAAGSSSIAALHGSVAVPRPAATSNISSSSGGNGGGGSGSKGTASTNLTTAAHSSTCQREARSGSATRARAHTHTPHTRGSRGCPAARA